jgi:hypothetical protein
MSALGHKRTYRQVRAMSLFVGELEKPSNEASCASPAPVFCCKP